MTELATWIYLAGALVFAVVQQIDNETTYYRGGAPSAILTGLSWPIWGAFTLLIGVGWLLLWPVRRRRP